MHKTIIAFVLIVLFTLAQLAYAPEMRKKVVILDTGITTDFPSQYLCSEGHKDFSGLGITDTHHHGTNIAYILKEYVNPKKECLLIVKFYNANSHWYGNHLSEAYNYILTLHPSYVNMSFGGEGLFIVEKNTINTLLKQGVIIAVAAGNSGQNLNWNCFYYPACYAKEFNSPNFYVVGSCKNGQYEYYSNYGEVVNSCENGTKVQGGDYIFTGTSQATAIKLGKIIRDHR